MTDERSTPFSRRRFLQAGSGISILGIAGCSGLGEPSETDSGRTDQPTTTATQTQQSSETQTQQPSETESTEQTTDNQSDGDSDSNITPPTISSIGAVPTQDRGTIEVAIDADHSAEHAEITTTTPTDSISETVTGPGEIDITHRAESVPGEYSTVTVEIIDNTDQKVEEMTRVYARESEVASGLSFDLGATYALTSETCVSGSPTIGQYSGVSEDVATQHADQLQGSGFSRIIFTIDRRERLEAASSFAEATLAEQIPIQFRFDFLSWHGQGVSLSDQLDTVREQIQQLPEYDSINGRPVILLSRLGSLLSQETPEWDELKATHGSVSEIIDLIRSRLTINGTKPFLVGETSIAITGWVSPWFSDPGPIMNALLELDAVQNGLPSPENISRSEFDGEVSDPERLVDRWVKSMEKRFRVFRLFAEKYDMEFVPRVAPGFVNSRSGCPPERRFPRDIDRFESLLQYATGYGTTDRIAVQSFNDWRHGTQIESGSMMGTEYGDAYLESAASVAQQDQMFAIGDRSVYHVSPDGNNWNIGSEANPLASIQEGVMRAAPGDTVQVHSGTYSEEVRTVRDGTPDAPIEITGPEDAILQPEGNAIWFKNNHIRLTGLTVDGLLDPDNPDDTDSYSDGVLIQSRPPDDSDEYLEDIVCAPAGIGNSMRSMMVFQRTKNLEIGPLRTIGIAGAEYVIGDLQSHVGEIVYLGQPPRVIEGRNHEEYNWGEYPWQGELDQTRDVHIHHIDNSEGYAHSQLVNTKTGTRDVLIEYCTDAGRSYNTEPQNKCADIRFQSYDATIRHCILRDGDEHGIQIGDPQRQWLREQEDIELEPERSGTGHSIYNNVIQGFGEKALQIDTTAAEQEILCGNEITGETDGNLQQSCSSDVPEGDGRGHLGGDSPWVDE